jgi:4-amino-4-deoxy-L-arabinose transferase-like glycosyltransferase
MTQHAMPFAPAAAAAAGRDAAQELPARLGRLAENPRLIVALACLLLLVPFLSKPLHMDDPMYVWAAEHILNQPLDPYGFDVNWGSKIERMPDAMKNPPLVCYYLAGAMMLLGRSEQALHLAMLLPAVGVILGTYQLAKELGSRPMLASAATLATPVFLLSATTIMCDVGMVCAYVWAVWFWAAGMKSDRIGMLCVASLLIAVSTLTKYFGVTLFPLLIAHGVIMKRRPGVWLLPLILPVGILLAFHVWTKGLYGYGLLADAAGFARKARWSEGATILGSIITGLSFTGGCCAAIVFLIGVATPRMMIMTAAPVCVVVLALLLTLDPIAAHSIRDAGGIRWMMAIQIAFWAACAVALFAAVAHYIWTNRSADNVMLGCWIAGTVCFAVFVNWNVAARSILPMAPAGAIVAAAMWTKRLETGAKAQATWRPWLVLVPGVGLTVLVCAADAVLARTQRDAAVQITETLAQHLDEVQGPKPKIFFAGHWGFQHYMQQRGATAIDNKRTALAVGDVVILPDNNTGAIRLPRGGSRVAAALRLDPMPLVSTMRLQTGAGFYSDIWGPLPFAIGTVPPERYQVLIVTIPLAAKH